MSVVIQFDCCFEVYVLSGEESQQPVRRSLSEPELQAQNAAYRETGGVSRENASAGFEPAFRDSVSGQTVVSCFADGRPAPVHVLDGLPDAWVASRHADGRVQYAVDSVVAGFVRAGQFFTREEAASALAEEAAL